MTNQHPITPPPELVEQWAHLAIDWNTLASLVAQWGADQELEACCMEIIDGEGRFYIDETSDRVRLTEDLWTTRRPKPSSLKEQALECLKNINDACESEGFSRSDDTDIIRRALESLPS
jgi:hypothetical protein